MVVDPLPCRIHARGVQRRVRRDIQRRRVRVAQSSALSRSYPLMTQRCFDIGDASTLCCSAIMRIVGFRVDLLNPLEMRLSSVRTSRDPGGKIEKQLEKKKKSSGRHRSHTQRDRDKRVVELCFFEKTIEIMFLFERKREREREKVLTAVLTIPLGSSKKEGNSRERERE